MHSININIKRMDSSMMAVLSAQDKCYFAKVSGTGEVGEIKEIPLSKADLRQELGAMANRQEIDSALIGYLPESLLAPLKELLQEARVNYQYVHKGLAMAAKEKEKGSRKADNDFMVMSLDAPITAGIIVNGELYAGASGRSGQVGEMVVNIHGERHPLNFLLSEAGIKMAFYKELALSEKVSGLQQLSYDELTSDRIFEAAQKSDPLAKAAFKQTCAMLGLKLSDIVEHLSPSYILLSGRLLDIGGEMFLDRVKQEMEANLLKIFREKVDLLPVAQPDIETLIGGMGVAGQHINSFQLAQ